MLTIATLCWAGNAIASRVAVGEVSPLALSSLRWLGVCGCVAPFYAREIRQALPAMKSSLPVIAPAAILGLTAFSVLIYVSAKYTTALNIGLLQGALPALVFLGAWLAYGVRITLLQAIGVVINMAGVAIISTGGSLAALIGLQLNRGDVLMLIAIVFYAIFTVAARNRPPVPPIVFFLVMALIAGAASLPLIPIEAALGTLHWPTLKGWLVILYVAFFPSFIAQIVYLRGIELIGSGRAGLFYNLLPAFTAILAVLLLGEPFGWPQGLALAMVLGGIALAERKPA